MHEPAQSVSKFGGVPLIADKIVTDSVQNGIKQSGRANRKDRQWKRARGDAREVFYRYEEDPWPG